MSENLGNSGSDSKDRRGSPTELVRHYAGLLDDALDVTRDSIGTTLRTHLVEAFASMFPEPSPAA
jgi:hypothetical protein